MAQKRATGLDIKVLEDKEVLLNFGDNPIIDRATGVFVGEWHSGGLEPNDSSWSLTRNVDSNDTALTAGVTATSYTAGAVTSTIDLIPGSPVLDYIEWPETVEQGGTLYRKHTAKVARAFIARVHKFQSGVVGIMVSREKAKLTVADRGTSNDPAGRTVNASWTNGDDEVMAEEMFYLVGEDGTVTRVEEKIFQDVADVQAQIDAGTAFVPQGSESGLKAFVPVAEDAGEVDLIAFEDPETGEPAEAGELPEEPVNP